MKLRKNAGCEKCEWFGVQMDICDHPKNIEIVHDWKSGPYPQAKWVPTWRNRHNRCILWTPKPSEEASDE